MHFLAEFYNDAGYEQPLSCIYAACTVLATSFPSIWIYLDLNDRLVVISFANSWHSPIVIVRLLPISKVFLESVDFRYSLSLELTQI